MKFALLILFSALLVSSLSYARKEPEEDYWKNMMKDRPMPDSIKGLLPQDPSSVNHHSTSETINKKQFNRHFDTRPIAIIYHKHGQPNDEKNLDQTVHEIETKKTTYPANKAAGSRN